MRNRTAAQIQKENLYGVGEVRLFSVGFQQFIYNISKKRDAKKLNRVFSHPLIFQVTIQNNSQINIPVHRYANNQPNNLHEFPSVISEKLDI